MCMKNVSFCILFLHRNMITQFTLSSIILVIIIWWVCSDYALSAGSHSKRLELLSFNFMNFEWKPIFWIMLISTFIIISLFGGSLSCWDDFYYGITFDSAKIGDQNYGSKIWKHTVMCNTIHPSLCLPWFWFCIHTLVVYGGGTCKTTEFSPTKFSFDQIYVDLIYARRNLRWLDFRVWIFADGFYVT